MHAQKNIKFSILVSSPISDQNIFLAALIQNKFRQCSYRRSLMSIQTTNNIRAIYLFLDLVETREHSEYSADKIFRNLIYRLLNLLL